MRIDMGTASYNNPEKLNMMLTNMRQNSISDWRFLVIDNASTDQSKYIFNTDTNMVF